MANRYDARTARYAAQIALGRHERAVRLAAANGDFPEAYNQIDLVAQARRARDELTHGEQEGGADIA